MSDTTAVIIPFGKYKGKPIEEVASQDPQYLAWLQTQDWFVGKFEYLIRYLTDTPGTGAPAPEETPAHNAMQVKFLDPDYRLAIAAALGLERIVREDLRKHLPYHLREDLLPVVDGLVLECTTAPVFEQYSDVDFRVGMAIGEVEREKLDSEHLVYVELKPAVGDDYPAVLRQMARQQAALIRKIEMVTGYRWSASSYRPRVHWVLLIDNFTGTGATLDQMSEMFANAGITVLMTGDFDMFAPSPNPSTKEKANG